MNERPCILFTAFEPSGDEHAAPVIAELRKLLPGVPIHGLGGPRMEQAGCGIIEKTSGLGLMLGDSAFHVFEHFRRVARVKRWARQHPVAVHVPTDSPAANWSFCRMIKKQFARPEPGRPAARVVHLVAPQVWAWASWRVRRLRNWSDLVLCLLPFEPSWFQQHGVRAQFIGHPVFERPLDVGELDRLASQFPQGRPRLALLPGSRPSELKANWPVLLDAWRLFQQRHPDAHAVVAAVDREAAGALKRAAGTLPGNLTLAAGQTDAVIRWSDVILTVSGTVTLHIARQGRPMTILYKVNPWMWRLIGKLLLETRTFTLPNLIELGSPQRTRDHHIVREFIPFYGPTEPLVDELDALLDDAAQRERQLKVQQRIVEKFHGHHAGREAAQAIADAYHRAIESR